LLLLLSRKIRVGDSSIELRRQSRGSGGQESPSGVQRQSPDKESVERSPQKRKHFYKIALSSSFIHIKTCRTQGSISELVAAAWV